MNDIKNEIIKIDDKLSVIKLGDQFYNDVINKYNNKNDFHIPSSQEGLFIADNYYMIFGPGVSYLTTETSDNKHVVTVDLGLHILSLEDINQKYPTILIKFS